MKHPTKREIKRLREKRRREELGRYTALCMQARMLCKLDERMQQLMHEAMEVVEGLDLGAMTNSTRHLQHILTMSGPALPYYLEDHWWAIARLHKSPLTYVPHLCNYDHEDTPIATRPGPVRPQAKIPGQAARFQNYRI